MKKRGSILVAKTVEFKRDKITYNPSFVDNRT